jgi:hypothetical protein
MLVQLLRKALAIAGLLLCCTTSFAEDTLVWQTNQNRVTADIQGLPLSRVLEAISQLTGWQVFVEPDTTHSVSAKFTDLSSGEALRLLLGRLSYAVVPQTNGTSRLYVFQSSMRNASQLVQPATLDARARFDARIRNELVVTLKPGAKIEELARLLGARVTGRLDSLNTYRLQFKDEETARRARMALEQHPDVESVDSNFSVEVPPAIQPLGANITPAFTLTPMESDGSCPVIVGLIDGPVGSLGSALDPFLLPTISVAGQSPQPAELTHGPAMAETILRSLQATSSGTSSARVLPVDVYGTNSATSTFQVAEGIYHAVNAGANVINLSLGSTGDSPILRELIRTATQQGVVFFSAAGNQPVTTPTYPAAYPEVIAVTAGDRNGQIANYANRGSFVDLMTPGTSIVPFNGQSYLVNGTSTATAYASGIAAGLADVNGRCPPDVIPTMRAKLPAPVTGAP